MKKAILTATICCLLVNFVNAQKTIEIDFETIKNYPLNTNASLCQSATGYSENKIFDEAFSNSAFNLPTSMAPNPDYLGFVKATDIGALLKTF